MLRYFEPKFEEYDLIHMHNRHFVINMTINGEKSPAFSAVTLNLPEQTYDQTASIIEHSRRQFAFQRHEVEAYVHQRHAPDLPQVSAAAPETAPTQSNSVAGPQQPAATIAVQAAQQPDAPQVKQETKPAKSATVAPKKERSPVKLGHSAVAGSDVEVVKLKRKRRRKSRIRTLKPDSEHTISLRKQT
jgi:hypothetical protein